MRLVELETPPTEAGCPTSATLERWRDEGVADSEAASLADHLDRCPACVETLRMHVDDLTIVGYNGESAADVDEFVDRLALQPPHSSADDDDCDALLAKLDPPEQTDEIARAGRFRLRRLIGRGGMSFVFAAFDPHLGREVALKFLRLFDAGGDARRRFLREARTAAGVRGERLASIHEVGECAGVLYIAMELLEGETLESRIAGSGPLDAASLFLLARGCGEALKSLHEAGVVHRDVKPANIWLQSPDGGVKLLDFGLAQPFGDDVRLTRSGTIVGTPAFMSPEQAAGRPCDARSDLFSLGSVLHFAATGRRPFDGDNVLSVLQSLAVQRPPKIHSINRAVPRPLSRLVERLLSKDPSHRPASADEVLKEIVAAEKASSRATRGRNRIATLVAAVFLAIVAAYGLAVFRFELDHGTLEIRGDAAVLAAVAKGNVVELTDRKSNRVYRISEVKSRLPSGDYQLSVADGESGLAFATGEFSIRRGETSALTATYQVKPRVADTSWGRAVDGKAKEVRRPSTLNPVQIKESVDSVRKRIADIRSQLAGKSTSRDVDVQVRGLVCRWLHLASIEAWRIHAAAGRPLTRGEAVLYISAVERWLEEHSESSSSGAADPGRAKLRDALSKADAMLKSQKPLTRPIEAVLVELSGARLQEIVARSPEWTDRTIELIAAEIRLIEEVLLPLEAVKPPERSANPNEAPNVSGNGRGARPSSSATAGEIRQCQVRVREQNDFIRRILASARAGRDLHPSVPTVIYSWLHESALAAWRTRACPGVLPITTQEATRYVDAIEKWYGANSEWAATPHIAPGPLGAELRELIQTAKATLSGQQPPKLSIEELLFNLSSARWRAASSFNPDWSSRNWDLIEKELELIEDVLRPVQSAEAKGASNSVRDPAAGVKSHIGVGGRADWTRKLSPVDIEFHVNRIRRSVDRLKTFGFSGSGLIVHNGDELTTLGRAWFDVCRTRFGAGLPLTRDELLGQSSQMQLWIGSGESGRLDERLESGAEKNADPNRSGEVRSELNALRTRLQGTEPSLSSLATAAMDLCELRSACLEQASNRDTTQLRSLVEADIELIQKLLKPLETKAEDRRAESTANRNSRK